MSLHWEVYLALVEVLDGFSLRIIGRGWCPIERNCGVILAGTLSIGKAFDGLPQIDRISMGAMPNLLLYKLIVFYKLSMSMS